VLTVFVFLSGFFFYSILTAVVQSTMMQAAYGQGSPPVDVPGIVTRSLFGTVSVVLLFMIPMITMGLVAEEKKRGTIELLLTAPVSNVQVMLGKYFATLTFLLIMFATSGITISALSCTVSPSGSPSSERISACFSMGRRCWRWVCSSRRSPKTRSSRV